MEAKVSKKATNTYNYLLSHFFTHKEAGEYSILSKGINDPTLRLVIRDREQRRHQFELIANYKLAQGTWTRAMMAKKWVDNLRAMYIARGWCVQYGPKGFQQRMWKGDSNPWSLYRHFSRLAPPSPDGYIAPSELKRYKGKAHLARGLVLVKKLERGKSTASQAQIHSWISQKKSAIRKTHDKRRKAQLRIEMRRLEALV